MLKIPHETCDDILEWAELKTDDLPGLQPGMTPDAVFEALSIPSSLLGFIRFFAHAVPAREGICWAHAVLQSLREPSTQQESAALGQVAAWITAPNESQRRNCMASAEALGTGTPVGWLALAVSWCGSGSIVPASLPAVMPPARLHAKAVFGAVALCLPAEANVREQARQTILSLARRVAEGEWPGIANHPKWPES